MDVSLVMISLFLVSKVILTVGRIKRSNLSPDKEPLKVDFLSTRHETKGEQIQNLEVIQLST